MANTYDSLEDSASTAGAEVDAPSDAQGSGGGGGQSDEDILSEARARLRLAKEAESEIRRDAVEDLRFLKGEQWPAQIRQEREADERPCLVINKLPQMVQQITNDQRQNRPAIKVHPLDNKACEETAKVIQGIIRHIEYNSNAEVAYDTAFESAAHGGYGYFRIVTDWESPDSFNQDIFVKRIRNPLSVFFDPYSQEPDGSDANWAFITDILPPEEYRAQYPGTKLSQARDWDAIGNQVPGWVDSKGAWVAEYFFKEFVDQKIHLLSTGETVKDDDLAEHMSSAGKTTLDVKVVKSRTAKVPVVRWVKMDGLQILERTDFAVPFIPIIPVYGSELFVDGKRTLKSFIRDAKDPQRMVNYWRSAETEAIALAPRSPFIGAEGQFEGYEHIWETANRKNHAFLPYKPKTVGNEAVPPPQRQNFEPAVQAITQAALAATDDLKSTTGMYDSSIGAQSNETAGVAIQGRSRQSQTGNFHFTDNLTRSMRYAGRIFVALIPLIYDTARAARVVKEDGTQDVVMVNVETTDPSGKKIIYALDAGRYDVTLDTGPSFASRRQEAAASMMDFSRAVPAVAQSCADLIAKNMDWPGAQEIAERLKKTLPPALQDDGKNKDVPPQARAVISQQGQMIQNLTQHLNEALKVIETKKLDIEHKERIELLRLQAQTEWKLAELGSKESLELLSHQIGQIETRLKYLQMAAPVGAPDDFDPQGADGGNYAGIGHLGGTENLTGGASPGSPMEGN